MISPSKKKLHLRIWISIAQIVGILLGAVVAVFFAERFIVDVSDSLFQKRKLTYTLENQKEIQGKLVRDLARMEPHEKPLRDTLPPGNNILPFVVTLDDIAKQRGLKQTYTFGVPTPPTGDFPLSRITFTITIRGNIHTLQSYLSDLLSIPYIIKVNSVAFTAPAEGWTAEGSATINATLFVKEPE